MFHDRDDRCIDNGSSVTLPPAGSSTSAVSCADPNRAKTSCSVSPSVARRRLFVKRSIDIILSLALAVALLPVMLLTAVVVRLTMGRPVLFKQQRPGREGAVFTLVKFRTMVPTTATDRNDDGKRITRVGRFLRATSLDELPTLINVISGSMSLVGPRPLLIEYLDRYSPEQARRLDVRPGITGLSQVLDRNQTTWERRLQLDVWYVDNAGLALDLKILGKTIWRVVSRRGISPQGHATMPEFEGND